MDSIKKEESRKEEEELIHFVKIDPFVERLCVCVCREQSITPPIIQLINLLLNGF